MELDAAAEQFLGPFAADDVHGFLAELRVSIGGGGGAGFHTVRGVLTRAGSSRQGFGLFALRALAHLVATPAPPEPWRPQVASLLADLGPGHGSSTELTMPGFGESVQHLVADSADISLSGVKLAARVLRAWGVQRAEEMPDEVRKAAAAAALRDAQASGGAKVLGAASLGALPGLLSVEAAQLVLHSLDDGNRDEASEVFVAGMSREVQFRLVQSRQASGRLRAAAKAVKVLGLEGDFPDADFAWRSEALESAISKGRREACVGLSCEEPRLKARCAEGLWRCGEAELASELGAAWGVPLPEEAAAAAAKARRTREETCLCLPPGFPVHIVDREDQLAAMRASILAAPAVGLDAEWAPQQGSPPSLLQLATAEAAFVVDLVTLASSSSLGQVLEDIFSAQAVIKVGFDGGSDVGKVGKAFGRCFRVAPLVDVRDLEAARRTQECPQLGKKRAKEGVSLASLAEKYMGKPLDKTFQVCDWGRRPLSEGQSHYAALDAWVPVRLYGLLT
ncbi:unnamed protein product [Polarella glacialis]|uniref:3'-5' exonuclease domain-containing protein n=1 Tax=Polarella glacialis TaxID=89957 RepID=A0A813FJ55_POLGL|nr:unnamed protein product [Polarella glacialis]